MGLFDWKKDDDEEGQAHGLVDWQNTDPDDPVIRQAVEDGVALDVTDPITRSWLAHSGPESPTMDELLDNTYGEGGW